MNEREEIMQATGQALNDILVAGDTDNVPLGVQGLTILVGGALCDLRRIAAAVEKLSNFNLTRVGDVVFGSTEQTTGLDLTPEEAETIEALRRGDIVVLPSGKDGVSINDADHLERCAMEYYRDNSGATLPWGQLLESDREHWREQYRKGFGG